MVTKSCLELSFRHADIRVRIHVYRIPIGTLGTYDAAEVCKIVGLYMLGMLSKKYEKSPIALYRDDGQAAFRSNSQL